MFDLDRSDEWLVANPLGCYAMGTPTRIPARKYHGLFVARARGRLHHVWSEVAETLRFGEASHELSCFEYDIAIHPQGCRSIVAFEDGERWLYQCGPVRLTRELRLDAAAPAARVIYHRLEDDEPTGAGGDPAELALAPLLTGRDAHALTHERDGLHLDWLPDGAVDVRLPEIDGTARLRVTRWPAESDPRSQPMDPGSSYWNHRVHYREEERRGYPHVEDLFAPGVWRVPFEVGDTVEIELAWRSDAGVSDPPSRETEAGRALASGRPQPVILSEGDRSTGSTVDASSSERETDAVIAQLSRAAATYCIDTADGDASIIAGYPWFEEWGRDAFIALSGLTLHRVDPDSRERQPLPELAGRVLDRFRTHRKGGLIPNIVGDDAASSDDHSVDATLFFIRAVEQLEESCGPQATERWWDDVLDLLEALRIGTGSGVKVESSGLLAADRRPRAMTWMDALIDGVAVTPRAPYAVEIQALFHLAIEYGVRIATRLGREEFVDRWSEIGVTLRESFPAMFECGDHLADSCDGTDRDEAVRPNQLYALIGESPLVRGPLARGVLASVRRELLTPVGLRTLEPGHPDYRGRCEGTQPERDAAYHQGTVWPWLLGPYLDAVAAVEGEEAARSEGRAIALGFAEHLKGECVGHISEIFDGDAPHTPRGAPAQAWSVAEVLRGATR